MKMYYFSLKKHAHDIDFRKNKVFCEMHDMEVGTVPMDKQRYKELCDLHCSLMELSEAMIGNRVSYDVTMLSGPMIGLAKKCVLWAAEARG